MSIGQAIREAGRLAQSGRLAALQELERAFCAGRLPVHLDGCFDGELVAIVPRGVAGRLAGWAVRLYLPWQGKRFVYSEGNGDNTFRSSSVPLIRLVWPGYKRLVRNGNRTCRALAFRTYAGTALGFPQVKVMRLDYDLPENPMWWLPVRRVVDELVQLDDGYYLGRAHLRHGTGWRLVGYFALSGPVEGS
jgi:hypothetical protein